MLLMISTGKVVYIFGLFGDIYAPTNVCVIDIDSMASMVLQNYQTLIVLTSNLIYIVALSPLATGVHG